VSYQQPCPISFSLNNPVIQHHIIWNTYVAVKPQRNQNPSLLEQKCENYKTSAHNSIIQAILKHGFVWRWEESK
jgi:hypothetical protein